MLYFSTSWKYTVVNIVPSGPGFFEIISRELVICYTMFFTWRLTYMCLVEFFVLYFLSASKFGILRSSQCCCVCGLSAHCQARHSRGFERVQQKWFSRGTPSTDGQRDLQIFPTYIQEYTEEHKCHQVQTPYLYHPSFQKRQHKNKAKIQPSDSSKVQLWSFLSKFLL